MSYAIDLKREQLEFTGWGSVGPYEVVGDQDGYLDVTGYNESDYWQDGKFLGPDDFGVSPVYTDKDGNHHPSAIIQMPYRA